MTNKHDSDKEGSNRTDEIISDYLLDVLGDAFESATDMTEKTVPISKFFKDASLLAKPVLESTQNILVDSVVTRTEHKSVSIPRVLSESVRDGNFLVPTLKLLSVEGGSQNYSREDAVLILLNCLYFLRRPLPPRVRTCFLCLSEQVIDDYHAAAWRMQVLREGVLS